MWDFLRQKMTRNEVEMLLQGTGNYQALISDNDKLQLTDLDSGFISEMARSWTLDGTGQPVDPRHLLHYGKARSFAWLGDFSELNAVHYVIGLGRVSHRNVFCYTEPKQATSAVLTCYYRYADGHSDDGIDIDRHPDLVIRQEFQCNLSIVDWDKYGDAYDEYRIYVMTLPDTPQAAEFCLKRDQELSKKALENYQELVAYQAQIEAEFPKFSILKRLVELSSEPVGYDIYLGKYRAKLIPNRTNLDYVGVYQYTPNGLSQLLGDLVAHGLIKDVITLDQIQLLS